MKERKEERKMVKWKYMYIYSNEELTFMNLETSSRISMTLSTHAKEGASRNTATKMVAKPYWITNCKRGRREGRWLDGSTCIQQ